MNEKQHPAMQPQRIGPPRTIRNGSLCENYVIWTALAYESCITLSDMSHTHCHSQPAPLDSMALEFTASDWDLHVAPISPIRVSTRHPRKLSVSFDMGALAEFVDKTGIEWG